MEESQKHLMLPSLPPNETEWGLKVSYPPISMGAHKRRERRWVATSNRMQNAFRLIMNILARGREEWQKLDYVATFALGHLGHVN